MAEGDPLDVRDVEPHGHETQPPARFTEASLVKRLEELGVGRPSTYASTIKVIQDREYVWKKGTALVPSFKAFAVVNLLEQHFPDLVDYSFTARMEDDLDEIAGGTEELVPWLSEFYFGPADANGQRAGGLKEMVGSQRDQIDAAAVNSIPIGLDPDGVAHRGQAGKGQQPVPPAGRRHRQHPGHLGSRRVDRREGARAAGRAQGRPRPRPGPDLGPRRLCQERSLRAVCAVGRVRRRGQDQAQDGLAVLDHDPRPHRSGPSPRAAVAASAGRRRSRRRGGDHCPERSLRPLHLQGVAGRQERQSQPHQRGAAAHRRCGRGGGVVRPAQDCAGARR